MRFPTEKIHIQKSSTNNVAQVVIMITMAMVMTGMMMTRMNILALMTILKMEKVDPLQKYLSTD